MNLRFWLSHIRHVETFIEDHERLLDVWEAGGVDGVVLGPLLFDVHGPQMPVRAGSHLPGATTLVAPGVGATRPVFDPDPRIYATIGSQAPVAPAADDAELRSRLHTALQAVTDRGWELWLFDPFVGAVLPDPDSNDNAGQIVNEQTKKALTARMLDTVAAFPEATGFIIDGPSWGFEITDLNIVGMERRRRMLELPASQADCDSLGYDLAELLAAQDSIEQRLHNLTRDEVRLHAVGGASGVFELLGGGRVAEWFRFRVDALTSFYQHMRDALHEHTGRRIQLAASPRSPALGPMAGYDYHRLSHIVDVIMPKFYFWHRGFDGLVGTAWRWANTLTAWNPELTVRDACLMTRMLFGDAMPVVDSLIDFDRLITAEYLTELTLTEAGRSLAAVGDRARVVPWVDTGRGPHDGDPMPAGQLDAILRASAQAGIDHVNFNSSTRMSAAEWTMLSHHCGTEWNPHTSPDWHPPDQATVWIRTRAGFTTPSESLKTKADVRA